MTTVNATPSTTAKATASAMLKAQAELITQLDARITELEAKLVRPTKDAPTPTPARTAYLAAREQRTADPERTAYAEYLGQRKARAQACGHSVTTLCFAAWKTAVAERKAQGMHCNG